MPFPLPIDPVYRKEIIQSWLDDCYDRLSQGRAADAEISWKIANTLYLTLPPGQGDSSIEESLVDIRVKINSIAT